LCIDPVAEQCALFCKDLVDADIGIDMHGADAGRCDAPGCQAEKRGTTSR
jgi:hypothetical protein